MVSFEPKFSEKSMGLIQPADLQNRFRNTKALVSCFTCKANGKSETYLGYKWLEQVARFCDTTLVTCDDEGASDKWKKVQTWKQTKYKNSLLQRLNGEIHFDYFRFNS